MSDAEMTPQQAATMAIANHGLFIEHLLITLERRRNTAPDTDQRETYEARRDRIDRMTGALETLSEPIMATRKQNIPQDLADGLVGLGEISRVQREFVTDTFSEEKVQKHLQGLVQLVQAASQLPPRQTGQAEIG